MDLFKLLKDDHAEVKKSLKKLTGEGKINRKEVEEACRKLQIHMEMEEKYLYPVMEGFKSAQDTTKEALLEHKEAKRHLKPLLDGGLDDVAYKVELEVLHLEIEHHVQEEEEELFPLIREKLSKEQIQSICEQMLALREKRGMTTSSK